MRFLVSIARYLVQLFSSSGKKPSQKHSIRCLKIPWEFIRDENLCNFPLSHSVPFLLASSITWCRLSKSRYICILISICLQTSSARDRVLWQEKLFSQQNPIESLPHNKWTRAWTLRASICVIKMFFTQTWTPLVSRTWSSKKFLSSEKLSPSMLFSVIC